MKTMTLYDPFQQREREMQTEYKFYRHRGSWRISLCEITENGWHSIEHISDHYSFEAALRETYRLNGWGEPKDIRQRY